MHLVKALRRPNTTVWIQILVLILAVIVPILGSTGRADADQMQNRSLTISTSQIGATGVTFTYGFDVENAGTIQSMEFEACTTALGSCTGPTGLDINQGSEASRSGWDGATTWVRDAVGGGGCTPAANVLCLDRTEATSETAVAKTLGWDTMDLPTTTAQTFFVRITTYSDTAWASAVDDGTVAAATVNQLTLTAKVEEILQFCVGDADAASANDCTDISGSTVDLDVLDSTTVNKSSTDGGSGDQNGYVMVRTNGVGGVDINYYGAVLTSGSNTIPAHTPESALSAGTSSWGMEVDGGAVDTSNGSTSNLSLDANFDNDDQAYWGATASTSDDIADSSTVVDDEMLVLDFHGAVSITQATGVYTTTMTFVATPTY